MLVPERRMVIQFAGLDPTTNRRLHSTGWTVTYDFTPGPSGITHVEISIEYRTLTALVTGGTAEPQAENEIELRPMGLRMLEAGVQGLQAGEPSRIANTSSPAHD